MRIKKEIQHFFKSKVNTVYPDAKLYLFGSRTNDLLKGGDIDILILSNEKLKLSWIRNLRVEFFKIFGMQKIDILNYTFNEQSNFKELILSEATPL